MPTRPPLYRPPGSRPSGSRAPDRRPGSTARGYGTAWQRLRLWVLKREPLCRECRKAGKLTPATDVDHITSRAKGGTDDPENLRSLCESCHSVKTAREDGGFGRQQT